MRHDDERQILPGRSGWKREIRWDRQSVTRLIRDRLDPPDVSTADRTISRADFSDAGFRHIDEIIDTGGILRTPSTTRDEFFLSLAAETIRHMFTREMWPRDRPVSAHSWDRNTPLSDSQRYRLCRSVDPELLSRATPSTSTFGCWKMRRPSAFVLRLNS